MKLTAKSTKAELLAALVPKCRSTRLSRYMNEIVKCELADGHQADHQGEDPVTGQMRTWEL